MKSGNQFDLFKTTIALSLMIIALSVAYFVVFYLPSRTNMSQVNTQNEFAPTLESLLTPTLAPSPTFQPRNTVSLLDQCLNSARLNQEDSNSKLIAWAEENNKDGAHNLSGAFDSIERQYERDRQDCFAKYPQ